MGETTYTLEELFSIKKEQKLKAGSCKVVCSLEAEERESLQAQIKDKLHHLLDQEPTRALLVCQQLEGCPVLRKVLRGSCWHSLVSVCCQHIRVGQDGQSWPPAHFTTAIRVLYTLLKERPTYHHHHQFQHYINYQHQHTIPFTALLEAAYVALTLALVDGGPLASGSHALVTSTTLCLLLQYLKGEGEGGTIAFLNTLWALNYLAGKRKKEVNKIFEEDAINKVFKDVKVEEIEVMDGNDGIAENKDCFRMQKEMQGGIREDIIMKNSLKERGREIDADNSQANTPHKKQTHTLTNKNDKQNLLKTTTKSNTHTKIWMLEDVNKTINNAKKNAEGRKLMRRKFEGMEESYSSSTLLLQGLLNAGGKWMLEEEEEEKEEEEGCKKMLEEEEEEKEEEEEGCKRMVFLCSLHPLILKLCSGRSAQYSYQAFQTLHLWIRAVRELGTSEGKPKYIEPDKGYSGKDKDGLTTTTMEGVLHPSKDVLFSMAPGFQGPVFTLLNASWESPVKGVGDIVVKCIEELLSLHEDGKVGSKRKLAGDMLEALIFSSSSSLSCVTSVWSSKSTYPPLALALTHLGCEEALHLYPSLPHHLVTALGVNHLAPASTCVYKVFLNQLKEGVWTQHFLTPFCEVLCSEDKQSQQHLISLWLPPTLKKYLGIHWALLASCGTTTPGWLARVALLKTARSLGAVELGSEERSATEKEEKSATMKEGLQLTSQERDILPFIYSALRHRDENIRLEALSLLCHTQKTSQPVSPFESMSIQDFLTYNMNIDSAPFRQGVLKCVAAILVRLRGATASYTKGNRTTGIGATAFYSKERRATKRDSKEDDGSNQSILVPGIKRDKETKENRENQYILSPERNVKERRVIERGSIEDDGSNQSILVPEIKRDKDAQEISRNHKENQLNISSPNGNPQKNIDLKMQKQEQPQKKSQEPNLTYNTNYNDSPSVLTTSADLVLWLIRVAHRGMTPDANYQRRILALQLYKEILMALLPPSNTLSHNSKRVKTNSNSLLMYLNAMGGNDTGYNTTKTTIDLPTNCYEKNQRKYDVKTTNDLPTNCYGRDRNKYDDKIDTKSLYTTNMKSNSDGNESTMTTLPLQDSNSDDKTTTTSYHPQNNLYSNTNYQKTKLQTHYNLIERKNKEGSQLYHPMTSIFDLYGDDKALGQPLVDLTYPSTLNTLLYLCMDEMNDVRAEAREIIHILTTQGKIYFSASQGREWMDVALRLCHSPKASDAESGGTLVLTVALLIPRECLGEVLEGVPGMGLEDGDNNDNDSDGDDDGDSSSISTSPSPPCLAEYLLTRVERQLTAAKTNLLKAAKYTPIHGTLQALGHYITQKKEEEQEEKKEGEKREKKENKKMYDKEENEDTKKTIITPLPLFFLPRLASLLQHLVEFILHSLSSTSPLGSAVPPSFAEMGEAVKRVVEEGKEDMTEEEEEKEEEKKEEEEEEEEEEESLLSSDDVLVLSCCWQILKSCCEVTSQVIHLYTHDPQAADDLIRGVVVRVLLGTRHKGAMEAARATYASLWGCLLQSAQVGGPFSAPPTCFVDILHKQVGEVVWLLAAPRGTSITRRSAGVAMMVQAGCGAAPRLTTTLLSTTVDSLTAIASSEVRVDESGTTDAPQALALHVLQSLALHSPLAPFLRSHLTPLTSTCLHAFASPSWAIRNAALQLFGSLVSSLVGQKKVRDDTSALNSLTTPEFISRHPSLVHLLLAALDGDLQCQESPLDSANCVVPNTIDTIDPSDNIAVIHDTFILNQDADTRENAKTHIQVLNTHTLPQDTHTDILKHNETHTPKDNATHTPTKDMHIDTHTPTHPGTHETLPQSHNTLKTLTHTSTHTPTPHNTATQKHTHTQTHIKSASILVPVLSLIARLSPGTGLQQNPHLTHTLNTLWHSTSTLLQSPVYSVRRLAALALVSLTPGTEALPRIMKILEKTTNLITSSNLLHGHLLVIYSFLQTHPSLAEDAKLRNSAAISLSWLLGTKNKCYVNTALALKIMIALGINILDSYNIRALESCLPGAVECHHMLTLAKLSQRPTDTIKNLFLSEVPVRSDILEICFDAILCEIQQCHLPSRLLKYEGIFWHQFEACLTPKTASALLHLLTAIMEKEESTGLSIPRESLSALLSCMDGLQGTTATCAALVLTAHLMRHHTNITERILVAFSEAITKHSHPRASEDHRLAASTALRVALKPVLTSQLSANVPIREKVIVSTVALLQDEDSTIRDTATGIIVTLTTSLTPPQPQPFQATPPLQPPHQATPPHPNLALYNFIYWLAKRSIETKDLITLKILWKLCNGQAGLDPSLCASALTPSNLRLFQSHSANLYYEPKQVSIMVGEALKRAIEGDNRQDFNEEEEEGEWQNPYQSGKEYDLQQNDDNTQENYKTTKEDSSNNLNLTSVRDCVEDDKEEMDETMNKHSHELPLTSLRDWLEEERVKSNSRGKVLLSALSKHNLWHHRLLAFEAGVYVVSCKVFKLLCGMFGVCEELVYPLSWGEDGYCVLDGVR